MIPAPLTNVKPVMAERIRSELAAIEREHNVKILLAVESGSRAWGFPSQDSDYDVRFIFVRPVEEYLTVVPKRDVIERPVDAVLDVSGWDVRKALQLMLKSNAVLQEWLSSPVRYFENEPVSEELRVLLASIANLQAFEYHYDHQARRSFAEVSSSTGEVRLKSYCYALRASLSLRWLRDRGTLPLMALPALVSGLGLSADLREQVLSLVDRKARSDERTTTKRIAELDDFIERTLTKQVGEVGSGDVQDKLARVNALFARVALGNWDFQVDSLGIKDLEEPSGDGGGDQ